MVVEIFLQNNSLTLQVFFIENTGQELFFNVYGGVLDFVVILQAVGRGHGMKNQWTIKT